MQEIIYVILIVLRVSFLDHRTTVVDLVCRFVLTVNVSTMKALIQVTLSNDSRKRRSALFDALRGASSDLESHLLNFVNESVFAFGIESFATKVGHLPSQRCLQAEDMGSGEFCRAQGRFGVTYGFRVGGEYMKTQQSCRGEQASCSHIDTEISH